VALNSDLLDIIDARIASMMPRMSAVGTIIEWTPPAAMVLFDGSTLAVPVKVFNDVDGRAGDRCGLMKFGHDWAVTGSFGARWPVQSGQTLVTFTSATSYIHAVSYDKAFPTGSAPRVVPNINSSAGVTGGWHVRAYNQNNSGFTIFLFTREATAASWANVPVTWVAVDDSYRL
jgi:hypothetical protein